MAFWSDRAAEPMRQFRWVVSFGGATPLSMDGISYALKKFSRPKSKITEVTHKYLNHSFYFPGRVEWEPVNLTFAAVEFNKDGGVGGPAQTLLSILATAGYNIPGKYQTLGSHVKTLSKDQFTKTVGNIHLRNIDTAGSRVVEGFLLYNPFFTSVEFGELDYGSEEIVDITCTIRYDYAKYSIDGNSAVAGTPDIPVP